MGDLIQLGEMPLETLTELAKESFADCAEPLKMYLDNEQKLKRFGDILKACRAKVPHGKWYDWVQETFSGQLSVRAVQLWISDAEDPEKRQKRLESERHRQQKLRSPNAQYTAHLAEQPPATPAQQPQRATTETITEASTYDSVAAQVAKPAWLADPDELDTAADPPPLPRTNTHHTADNRRTPDARETDRAGLVSPDDPRELEDGHWYQWSEQANRLFAVTNEQILQAAALLRVAESVVVAPAVPADEPKPGKLPTLMQLRTAITYQVGWSEALRQAANDWAAYKMSLSGKEKVRSMDSWKKALVRMANVAKSQSVSVVCEAIEKAIANGWTGWEHLDKVKASPAQLRSQAAGTEDFGISYEVVE